MILFPLLSLVLFLSETHFASCFLHEIPLTKLSSKSTNISTSINPSWFYTLPISIGTPSQPFNVIIATGSSSLLIADTASNLNTTNKYNASNSSTFINTNQPKFFHFFDDSLSYGLIYNDTVSIGPDFSVTSFPFTSLIHGTLNPSAINDGILGMNRNNTNIIPLLKNHYVISGNIFSLYDPETTDGTAFMYIDEVHSNFTKDAVATCEAIENDELYWKCNASYIIITNDNVTSKTLSENTSVLAFEEQVIFDSGSNAFMFPHKYEGEFLRILNSINQCKVETATEDIEYITCPKEYIRDIHIVINNYSLKIKKENIWETIEDEKGIVVYGLNVFFNKKETNVIIGMQMFKGYHVLFNKDDKEIKFYTHNEGFIVKIANINILLVVALSIFGSLIILAEILLLYFFLCKNESKTMKNIEGEIKNLDEHSQQLVENQD